MWKFVSASDVGQPRSLNGNKGRQVWVFDPEAGTPEEREAAEQLRRDFTANRLEQKHSADELLRWGARLPGGRHQ